MPDSLTVVIMEKMGELLEEVLQEQATENQEQEGNYG